MDENSELVAVVTPRDSRSRLNLFRFLYFKNRNLRIKERIGKRKRLAVILAVLFSVLTLIAIVFAFAAIQAYGFYFAGKSLSQDFLNRDFPKVKADLVLLKKEQKELSDAYRLVMPLKLIPFFGSFVSDGERAIRSAGYGVESIEILVSALEPYADVIGFSGANSGSPAERLDFLVDAIPHLTPEIGKVVEKLAFIKHELAGINPNRYPGNLFGFSARQTVSGGIGFVSALEDTLTRGEDLLSASPYLLGADEKREYLIIFQNDKELRPTGGFMTAYTVADVEKGVFHPVSSSDIYSLDASYTPRIPAAEPVVNYIQGPYVLDKNFRIRDINWSPDFPKSMELFLKEAETAGLTGVDGVVGVDTQLLVNLLDVVGPIDVPGYGEFSTKIDNRCNCAQVIYDLESFSDVEGPIVWDPLDPTKIIYAPDNFDNRKEIIGPLMNSLVTATLSAPKEKLPLLFNAIYKSFLEKHVLLYMKDDGTQNAVEGFGIAGKVENYDGDYLMINDANLGGRKSNLYARQAVDQEVVVSADGSVEKRLKITYKNPQAYDGWLNSVLPNWTRVYLPEGSEILDVSGFEETGEVYSEFGKTVVSGGFKLRPQGVSIITIDYRLPFRVKKEYKVMIQKQPGTDAPVYTMKVGNNFEEFVLNEDAKKSYNLP